MKTKKRRLSIPLGIFLLLGLGCIGVGTALASEANILQPAATVTYNEDLTVNGTGSFDSIKIGKQGVGGVTFFNGSIINATIGENDYNNPITIADNVRIDGAVFRGELPGTLDDKPFSVKDNLYVEGGITGDGYARIYDDLYIEGEIFGLEKLKINDELEVAEDAKFNGAVEIADLQGTGIVSSDNILDGTIKNQDLAGSISASKISGTALIKSTTFGGDVSGTYNNLQLGSGVVGSGEINNGAIVNEDISGSAAIDPSKISGTAWTANNDGAGSGLDADKIDGIESGSLNYVRSSGYVDFDIYNTDIFSTTITIPHYTKWRLELYSGQTQSHGMAIIEGFENDYQVDVLYSKYNGRTANTSEFNHAYCDEDTTNILVDFGTGSLGGTLKCPGEDLGDHNLVIENKGSSIDRLYYKLIY